MTYEELLLETAQNNPDFMVLTAENRGAIRNLPPKIENQFIDTGITEMTMIGISAGLALRGRKPAAHALAAFLTMRAFEFIRTDIGIKGLPVKIVGAVPGFLSDANGPTHQAIEDVAIMRGIPTMNVFCPADKVEMVEGLKKLFQIDEPYYVRFAVAEPVVEHSEFEPGKAETFGNGTDIGIITYGFMFNHVMKAKELLEAEGKSVRVINMRTLKPADEEAILKTCEECSTVVTVEDHFKAGGLYTVVAETLLENRKTADVMPIALDKKWFKPALLDRVLEYEGFTPAKLTERILNYIKK